MYVCICKNILSNTSLNLCESVLSIISDLFSVVEWLTLGTSIMFVRVKTRGWGTGGEGGGQTMPTTY